MERLAREGKLKELESSVAEKLNAKGTIAALQPQPAASGDSTASVTTPAVQPGVSYAELIAKQGAALFASAEAAASTTSQEQAAPAPSATQAPS